MLTRLQRISIFALFTCAVAFLYLYNLNGTGVLEPDEPRYASIGRAMAQSGDWVTPRLWGSPWFEKPAFLYWMTALGTEAGLDLDLSGRLPVALLSLVFLAVWFALLRDEFGERASATATLLLATSAGWLAFSSLCLTDLPLAAFFSLGIVLVLRLIRDASAYWRWIALGCAWGLALLAKGLVPVVSPLPSLWFLRRHWRRWWLPLCAAVAVAVPWYALVIARNGFPFVEDFFVKQHFARLYSQTLQHVQPIYFYVPVLLGAVFPWTPLLLMTGGRRLLRDPRVQFLLVTFAFGFVFFSVSINKLPSYLLPLLPSLFAFMGIVLAERSWRDLNRVGCSAVRSAWR